MPSEAVLTIAGSDSGGGAGIQADLAAFAYFDVFGATAVTAVTAQNPHCVSAVLAVPPHMVEAQIEAVFAAFDVRAVKTGMLLRADIAHAVAGVLGRHRRAALVVDPVMVATSGAELLDREAVGVLREELLPLADLVTPNLPEAEVLTGRSLPGLEDAIRAARQLRETYGSAFLLKGGHAKGPDAVDVFCMEGDAQLLRGPRIDAPTTHGTGCSLSAAAVACLAGGMDLKEAVRQAKAYVLGRLRAACRISGTTWVLSPPGPLPLAEVEYRIPRERSQHAKRIDHR